MRQEKRELKAADRLAAAVSRRYARGNACAAPPVALTRREKAARASVWLQPACSPHTDAACSNAVTVDSWPSITLAAATAACSGYKM
ncbi:hypothetical protein DIPPA_10245 [Diplonema papillatum]|nr:hypothetical protein DIPPA_10245 [Diplonema papillatum]